MATEVQLYDAFEVSSWPVSGTGYSWNGAGDYPQTFGPTIEPLTLLISYPPYLTTHDSVILDGSEWSVTKFVDVYGRAFAGDPNTTDTSASRPLVFFRLSNGTSERYFGIELDDWGKPLIGPDGEVAPITHYNVELVDTSVSTLNLGVVKTNDPEGRMVDCFTTGTMIETAQGPRPVERLAAGDLVRTRDHGLQPLRWIGGQRLSPAALARAPKLVPIRISAGALGQGLPAQDLVVSPQHRVLVRSPIAARMAGSAEVLVAAVHLVGMPGITRSSGQGAVGYWHLMFDAHEIVFANGAEAESLWLGPMAQQGLSPEARAEIAAIFPDLLAPGGSDPRPLARPVMRGGMAAQLCARQIKNRKPLVAAAG